MHTQQHRQHIIAFLSKLLANHLSSFRKALDRHSANVEERNRRVEKYSSSAATTLLHTIDQLNESSTSTAANAVVATSKYAMFNPQSAIKLQENHISNRPLSSSEKHLSMLRQQKTKGTLTTGGNQPPQPSSTGDGLHRRHQAPTTTQQSSVQPMSIQQQSQQQLKAKNDIRFKHAQQAEQSIRQVRFWCSMICRIYVIHFLVCRWVSCFRRWPRWLQNRVKLLRG